MPLPWLREAVRLDGRREEALPQAPPELAQVRSLPGRAMTGMCASSEVFPGCVQVQRFLPSVLPHIFPMRQYQDYLYVRLYCVLNCFFLLISSRSAELT